ncbi:phage tail protein [Pseudomonas azerbaijanoccidens]|uniref:phage tail protein n=1 Tax=Pseudomonas azerbaijanoccidentalis TaxID=2842347 RepID=UPI00200AABD8|nr:phage tail protein [Pseudomonas azerbaijanoccidentalis]MCK8669304.1 phage tail protein [Pseudomonas azerbaijanoccidentalis]
MLEFTWLASYDASKVVTPNAKVIKFGDNYEQRQASGINRKPRKFSLSFTRSTVEIDAIETFLSARGAVEAFKYTHPGQPAGVFVCREWTRTDISFAVHGLSADFEEVFE